jgi:hypothetical protein
MVGTVDNEDHPFGQSQHDSVLLAATSTCHLTGITSNRTVWIGRARLGLVARWVSEQDGTAPGHAAEFCRGVLTPRSASLTC